MVAHTMFSTSPFKPKGYNQAVMASPHRLGFDVGDFFDFFGDFLGVEDINAANLDEFLGKLDDLIEDLPVGSVKKDLTNRRAACMTKSTLRKYSCLWDLFQEAKRAVRNEDGGGPAPTPTPTGPPAPSAEEFPWVPVGIAGGITVAALVYLVIRKKA